MSRRGILLVCLIFIQLWVPIGFGGTGYADSPFLDTDDLTTDYESHIGDEAIVYGQVVSVEPVVIRVDSDEDQSQEFQITGLARDVSLGQYVEVYGIVGPDQAITAKGTVVRGEREHWYTYGISALAGFLVLGRIIRDWQITLKPVSLKPRVKD